MNTIYAADLFCGAGGFSTALLEACQETGHSVDLLAVNHWDVAIATHSLNHPGVRHLQADIDGINPRVAVPGGRLHLLVASPECTHHSKARGGRPMNDQSRATGFCILRWAEALDIDHIIVENVEEFRDWGPLYPDDHPDPKKAGRPIKSKKGQSFQHFLRGLRIMGYTVDHQVLNSAYFGAATARRRLFIQARKGRKKIVWPVPTHSPEADLFGARKFRSAREIIDWKLQGKSIYGRRKPLSENTMRRIYAGLRKFSGLPFIVPQFASQGPRSIERPLGTLTTQSRGVGLCQPFLVVLRRNADARSLDEPVPTLCAKGNYVALCEPFLVGAGGPVGSGHPNSVDDPLGTVLSKNHRALIQPYLIKYYGGHDAADVDKPLPTITANYEHFGLIQPFLVKYHGDHDGRDNSSRCAQSLDEPIKTLDTQPRFGLAEPYLVSFKGNDDAKSLDNPLGALCTKDRFGLCEPFLVNMRHFGDDGHARRCLDPEAPMPTITGQGAFGLAEPFVIPVTHGGGEDRAHNIEKPLPTITTAKRGELALVEPFIVKYYGSNDATGVDEPLPTVTTKDRFALVDPVFLEHIDKGDVVAVLDIRFRMLQPHELASAMGFPEGYKFAGNREAQVKQIGNAVEKHVGKALCKVALQ